MFTELYKESGLTINTIPNYVLITTDVDYNDGYETYYYVIPLSEITPDELEELEYTIYYERMLELQKKWCKYKTDSRVIKANIVAVYRK